MPCQTPFRDDSAQLLLFKIASCISSGGAGVTSFNGRDGVVTLTSGDVTTALGFTPLNTTTGDARYVLKTGDTMTGALAMPAGSAALPSNTFSGDTNTGMYSPGADSIGFSTGGTLRLTVASTAVTSTVPILAPDGTAALPAFSFSTDTDTGLYRIGANSFGSAVSGFLVLATSTTGVNLTDTLAYQYNSVNVIRAQTALNNYFFGPSGNLTATGIRNNALGGNALSALTSGARNVAFGHNSLLSNNSGADNTALGQNSLLINSSGSNNVALGSSSLNVNTTGNNNLGLGTNALLNVSTGSNNVGIGVNSGAGITTGSNNTIIGANVTGLAAALSDNIILADGAGVIRLQINSSGNTTLAGTVQTAAGTAALPAFSFTADPNTGLYNIGADSIGTSTGGVLRITTNTTDVILATAFRLAMASGANQRAGNAVLVGGTVTVANTSVTANTIVLLTRKTAGGTIGTAITYTTIAATSFTINSDSVIDTSTFSYLLLEVP